MAAPCSGRLAAGSWQGGMARGLPAGRTSANLPWPRRAREGGATNPQNGNSMLPRTVLTVVVIAASYAFAITTYSVL
ncbi:MAG TPA: hypothetical protein VIL25_01185, partial [Vicinamibacterales bacterium]